MMFDLMLRGIRVTRPGVKKSQKERKRPLWLSNLFYPNSVSCQLRAAHWVCVTFLGSDSTQVEFAMRWRDFNRPQRVTQNFDAHPTWVSLLTNNSIWEYIAGEPGG
jgi:phenylpropionate dioxygenase-like ring-hydroxylating dioxygenase large terminal subunit